MILIKNAYLQRGTKTLLADADLILHAGMRVGLVGRNGCGKSSVFALLTGALHADRGDVEVPRGWRIAQVVQDTPAVDRSARDYVLDGDSALRSAEAELVAAEASDDGERLGHAHERFGAAGGYTAGARASVLLSGLGFASHDHDRPVREFSGGWRMRLNLAQALACPSDLMLLDEPTNHLDLDAILWLEDWLAEYPGTLLIISHDREFLDATARTIVGFDHGKLRLYTGNYSSYERARAEQLSQSQSLFNRQQKEVARLHAFVERFRAKASKAKQAQSRVKALERMELIAPAHVDAEFTLHFREFPGSPDPALLLEDASVGYDDKAILSNVSLTIPSGSRIGLVGVNGAGKSTLVKLLGGSLQPISGVRREGKNLRIGYFAQHQLELLRLEEGPLAHLKRIDPQAREQVLRDFLGRFNFGGDMIAQTVGTMSGGEQARLALALIIWQRPNLLLLDEPTNHLDLDMREALTMALQEFEGAMILVSHDRHLLRTATDELMIVSGGRVTAFDGDLDEYRQSVKKGAGAATAKATKAAPNSTKAAPTLTKATPSASEAAPVSPKPTQMPQTAGAKPASEARDDRRVAAHGRQARSAERKPVTDRIARIDRELAKLNLEKSRIDTLLASESIYVPEQKPALLSATHDAARIATTLRQLEDEWLQLHENLEQLGV